MSIPGAILMSIFGLAAGYGYVDPIAIFPAAALVSGADVAIKIWKGEL